MKSKFQIANILSVLVILAILVAPVSTVSFAAPAEKAQPPESDGAGSPTSQAGNSEANQSSTGLYIVRLADASLAAYTGGVDGLEATSPAVTKSHFVDLSTPASAAYLAYLQGKHAEAIAAMEQALGRSLEVRFQYLNVLNGMAVAMSASEAVHVSKLSGVLSVTPDKIEQMTTDVGPTWIGAPAIWGGSTIDGASTQGEGVIIAVLDSGINHDHPSFATTGEDGYTHTNPYGSGNSAPGSYCDTTDPTFCTDKLIGAWDFHPTALGPEDTDGHGSHTASTAGGNVVTSTLIAPTASISDTISGVAPHANIIAYKVCEPSCPQSSSVAAVNQAIADRSAAGGVPMALNFSISGSDDPWNDTVDLAFLDAFNAGIYVSASAGNNGPGASTVAHTGPWNATTAASTHNRALFEFLENMSGGATTPPADMQGAGFTAPYGSNAIVYAGDFGDPLCPTPFPAGTWTNGEIVICDRGGGIARVDKGANVLAGGAGGYVLANDAASGASIVADPHFLPAVHITFDDGVTLKTWVADGGSGHVGEISGTVVDYSAANGDVMGSFSSRGPSQFDLLEPDYTAPGIDVWAAYCCGVEYTFLGGTSMSSPHSAGSGALMLALHPTWSPAEVLSAIKMTAQTNPVPLDSGTANVFKEDGVTPADWFDMGSGRIALGGAAMAGLVMEETGANFAAANPDTSGDPRTLNVPSMQDWNCVGTCVFTRTVSSPLSYAVDWTATSEVPAGTTVSVNPSSFTLPGGGSQELVITVDTSSSPVADWQFANVILTPSEPIAAPEATLYTAPAATGPLPEGAVDTVGEADGDAPSVAAPLSDFRVPEAVLYDNGPLVTHPGGGGGGADESRLQNSSLGMIILGFSDSVAASTRVADEFTISDPDGWDIENVIFYGYQTGSTTVSTFTAVNLQIWDGPPNAGGTIIWGDTTTNVMTDTVWTNMYRASETSIGNTTRPVMANTTALGGLHLDPGTYWLDWQAAGSLASGPWAPPITIIGQTTTGNALQFAGGVWNPILDDNGAGGGTMTPQGMPFTILGNVTPPPPTTFCSAPNVAIPDNNPTGVSDSLVIADASTILDVNLTLTVTHTWVGDLIFTLTHNDTATSVVPFDRPGVPATAAGCSGNDLNGIVLDDDGEGAPGTAVETSCTSGANPTQAYVAGGYYTPNNPLSTFDGETHTGTWTLNVSDNAGADLGTLEEWCVSFAYGTPYVDPAPAHLAIAVVNPGSPIIEVSPDTMESAQAANQIVNSTLTISNTGTGNLDWSIFEDPTAPTLSGLWSDNFDSYPTGQDLHGVGGWKGWDNTPSATAFTSAAQALSTPNSVDISAGADLVHEYAGATSGVWTYTAMQYIPSSMTGLSYFILLNTYSDGGAKNWSTQVNFDAANNTVVNDGITGGTLALVEDQWVEIRVEIDLNADTQDFYYNNQLLYSGTWTDENSGNGALNIGAVDLYANGASAVYYDDISLVADAPPVAATCDFPGNLPWLSVAPANGSTTGGSASDVTVGFDSTGLTPDVYTGTLCVTSNDVTTPLVTVPVTLTVLDQLPPSIEVSPDSLANTQGPDVTTTLDLVISNTGEANLDWSIDEDATPGLAPTVDLSQLDLTGLLSGLAASPAEQSVSANGGGVLYDQTDSPGINGAPSQFFTDFGGGGFGAEDFVVPVGEVWSIDQVMVLGSYSATDGPAPDWDVNVYADGGGLPGTLVASATAVVAASDVGGDVTLDLATSLDLPAGTYWLSVNANMAFGADTEQWFWSTRTVQSGQPYHWQDPLNLFATGCTTWMPGASVCGVGGGVDPDLLFQISGTSAPAGPSSCDVAEDITWASVNPTSGTTAGGSASTVEVTFDSTGLSAGVYTGTLCVGSNDLANPLVIVPLTLTVDVNADLSITKSAPAEVTVGDDFTYTLEVTNNGPATAVDTTVSDTLPAGVTFVSATAGCTEAAGVVTCDLGDLASGGTATVEIVVTADAVGTVNNTASVASSSPDPDTTDNSDSAETDVVEAPEEEFWIYLPIVVNESE